MRVRLFLFISVIAILASPGAAFSQTPDDRFPSAFGDQKERETPPTLKEMLSKQRILHDKKEFAELQERGDEALRLSRSLEISSSSVDREKLVELERVVKKIRSDLGADGNDDADEDSPNSFPHAVKSLQEATASLVGELKKATRFTISAAAIQTSNNTLKLIRFLLLKR